MSFASVAELTSLDSPFVSDYDYAQLAQGSYFAAPDTYGSSPMSAAPWSPDVAIRRDSHDSELFKTPTRPMVATHLRPFQSPWMNNEIFESPASSLVSQSPLFDLLDSPQTHIPVSATAPAINVEESDRPLLNHFLNNVSKMMFPVLDLHQQGATGANIIVPALASNPSYLHCCLNVSAMHLKASGCTPVEQIDNDVMKHRFATASIIRQALDSDTAHSDVLETTLAIILFRSRVQMLGDSLPDLPWHQHLQAATSLAHRLQLPQGMISGTFGTGNSAPIDMTLTAWLDIIGATMRGTTPHLADFYRSFKSTNRGVGLAELTGCDDQVMYLIAETACLEAQKAAGMDETLLCKCIEAVGAEIGLGETSTSSVRSPTYQNGAIDARQLTTNLTTIYRIAARVYLCSLVPGFPVNSPSIVSLISRLAETLNYIPAGRTGFDTSIVWPLLVSGAVSTPDSPFRAVFAERCFRLGTAADVGSFGMLRKVLTTVWAANDHRSAASGGRHVHWREVMQQNGWDFLLV